MTSRGGRAMGEDTTTMSGDAATRQNRDPGGTEDLGPENLGGLLSDYVLAINTVHL